MDRITESFVGEFADERELSKLNESDKFEAFAAYCVISELYDEEFDVSEVIVGGSNDLGIDAACLIVNGALVSSAEEIVDLRSRNNYLQAAIIIVQAKTTSGFEGSTMTDLADNLCDMLGESPTLPMSDDVKAFKVLLDTLYANSSAFRRRRPALTLRYVTTGTWTDDKHLVAKRNTAAERLTKLNLFDVDIRCLGAREVQDLYRQAKNSVESSFDFPSHVNIPKMKGVSEAYIGIVAATEYLKLIVDGGQNIRKSLFYDNVRDFQDYNPVNQEIRETLQNVDVQDRFVVLNNGVTVVARELSRTGDRFTLRDYQIVNGCQTSHVLFDERDHVHSEMYVPLKVIVTTDEDVVSSITTATNRQTTVSEDDLRALDSFQKDLEAFFVAHPVDRRLYYERRSKQYSAKADLQKTRIIAPPQLIRAYASMFLDEPWRAGRYYKELQKLRSGDIFKSGDSPFIYYVSAVAAYRLDYFFRNGNIDVRYKPARYQMLMGARHLHHGDEAPPSGGRKLEKYCSEFADILWDQQAGLSLFEGILPVVDRSVAQVEPDGVLDRDTVRTQQFTDLILSGVKGLRDKQLPRR